MLFKLKNRLRSWRGWLLAIVIILSVNLYFYQRFYEKSLVAEVNNSTLHLLVADTFPKMYKGLSDRDFLKGYDGMIFLFPTAQKQAMVMRRMRFPIDIVWINDGVVVDIAPEVPLEPGKSEAELTRYTPRLPANTVLELQSGLAEKLHIAVGSVVHEVK